MRELTPRAAPFRQVEKVFEEIHITLNKNAVHGDVSAMAPGGIRIGTPAMTTRGLVDSDFEIVAEHLHSAVRIALRLQLTSGPKLKSFASLLDSDAEVALLRERVVSFASGFPMPGDVADS